MDIPEMMEKNWLAILPLVLLLILNALFYYAITGLSFVVPLLFLFLVVVSYIAGRYSLIRYHDEGDTRVFYPFLLLFFFLLSILHVAGISVIMPLGKVGCLCICGCGPPPPAAEVAWIAFMVMLITFPAFILSSSYPLLLFHLIKEKKMLKNALKIMLITYLILSLAVVGITFEKATLEEERYYSQPNGVGFSDGVDMGANGTAFEIYVVCNYNGHVNISDNLDAEIRLSSYSSDMGERVYSSVTLEEAYGNWLSGNSTGVQYVDADHDLAISFGDYVLVPCGNYTGVDSVYMVGKYIEPHF